MDANRQKTYSKKNIINNMAWRILERLASETVTIIVSVILLRILSPSEYGLVAIITSIIAVLNILLTSGLGDSLIQKKDADSLDFSSLFWLNLGIATILYIGMFISAPFIASYYGYNQLKQLIRVLCLRFVITAVNHIQCAYVARNMLFKHYFFSTISSKIGSGIAGIVIALFGGGAWALVAQNLLLLLIETCVLWHKVRWRPELYFSWERASRLISFGWKILFYQFAVTVSNQIRNFIIGKRYSSEDMAFYSKGNQFPNAIGANMSTVVNSIMFPLFSHFQDERALAISYFRKSLSMLSYCIFPVLIGLAAIADNLVIVLYTDKWLPMVPYLRIACISYSLYAMELPMRLIINSIGLSATTMKIELIKCAVTICVVVISIKIGITAIAYSLIFCELFTVSIYLFEVHRRFEYRLVQYLQDIIPNIILSICMAAGVYVVSFLQLRVVFSLSLQIVVGVALFIMLSVVFRVPSFKTLYMIVKTKTGCRLRTMQETN